MVRIRYQQTSTASLLLTEVSLEQNTDADKLHPSLELPCNAIQPYIQMHPAHNIGTASKIVVAVKKPMLQMLAAF